MTNEREEELKPCPFCGGKARAHDTIQWSLVSCDECSAEIRGYTKDEAIEAWNRRVE